VSEELINGLILVALLMVAWIVRLTWVNRKLHDRLNAQSASQAIAPAGGTPEEKAELVRLRERVAVLERITVDKENSLAREIDGLRDR
jgi:hypothetical protein